MDKQIKDDIEQMIKRSEHEDRSCLLSSIGRLFSKLLKGVKNKIVDELYILDK